MCVELRKDFFSKTLTCNTTFKSENHFTKLCNARPWGYDVKNFYKQTGIFQRIARHTWSLTCTSNFQKAASKYLVFFGYVSRIHSSLLCYLELGNDCHAIVVRLSWQHLESRGPFSLFSFISVYLSNFPGEQPSCASFIRHTDTERITWRRLAQQWHPHRLCLGIRHPENLLPFCDDPQPTTVDQAVALLNVGFQRPQVLMRSLPSRFMKQKPPGVFFLVH